MIMTVDEKARYIARHYGYYAQSLQAIEELSELITAIAKHRRAAAQQTTPFDPREIRGEERCNVIEEMADVTIMMWQMQYLLGIDGQEVYNVIRAKLERQLDRIEKEK